MESLTLQVDGPITGRAYTWRAALSLTAGIHVMVKRCSLDVLLVWPMRTLSRPGMAELVVEGLMAVTA